MTKVVKDGITMVARDKNQLAAFLNNGWKETEEKPLVEEQVESERNEDSAEESDKSGESTGETSEGEKPCEAEPPKRGRKPAQK
jgi:hypothetical protein